MKLRRLHFALAVITVAFGFYLFSQLGLVCLVIGAIGALLCFADRRVLMVVFGSEFDDHFQHDQDMREINKQRDRNSHDR